MNDDAPQHLLTKYVFIDAEAFRKAQFDWTGRTLSKLVEFAEEGHLHLLTTEVTKIEIRSQLREVLGYAAAALKKHDIVLRQVGAEAALAAIPDDNKAIASLDTAFEQFLKSTKAINVPLCADLSALFSDYFARRPLSARRKNRNFRMPSPSHRCWRGARKSAPRPTLYPAIPILKRAVRRRAHFFHAASVADIISQATVSRELHEALEKALAESDQLSDLLTEQIKDMDLESARGLSQLVATR